MTTCDLTASINRGVRHEPARRVLLVHGQPGTSAVWNRVRPGLDTLGLRVMVGDQLDNASRLSTLLRDEPPPTVVVGHSLGAAIAAEMAVIAPEQVRALVLVAPALAPNAITPNDRLLAAQVIGPALSWLGIRGGSAGNVADARRMRRRIGEIACPVLIVAGVRDRLVSPKAVSALAERLPNARVRRVDSGHLIPLDQPRAVVSAVLDVLSWEYRMSLSARGCTGSRETT